MTTLTKKREARLKVSRAAKTTDEAGERIRLVLAQLLRRLSVNSLGVYTEPVGAGLIEAIEELQRVREFISETAWPTEGDYDRAGY